MDIRDSEIFQGNIITGIHDFAVSKISESFAARTLLWGLPEIATFGNPCRAINPSPGRSLVPEFANSQIVRALPRFFFVMGFGVGTREIPVTAPPSRCGADLPALPPGFRPARNFTSAPGAPGDLVAGDFSATRLKVGNRRFRGCRRASAGRETSSSRGSGFSVVSCYSLARVSTLAQQPITFQYFYDDLNQLAKVVDLERSRCRVRL